MGDPYRHEVRRLSSGAQLFHMHRNLPWTAAAFIIPAGHMHDPVGKEGTAHLLEHYLSGGSIGDLPAMSKPRLREWIEDQGLMVNLGETSSYRSLYAGRALNDAAGTLLGFLSDLLFRPGFDNDIAHDREIVRAERRHRLSRGSEEISAITKPIFYGTHRRATMTGLPADDVLNAIAQRDLLAFHRRYYGAPNLRIVALGGASVDQLMSELERCLPLREHASFEAIGPIPPLPLKPFAEREWTFDVTHERPAANAELCWTWKMPLGDFAVRAVAERCLSSILLERLRERMRATYHVSTDTYSRSDHADFEIEVHVAAERAQDIRAEVEASLLDIEMIRARVQRVRRATERQTLFMDLKSADILENASMSVAAIGRIETMEERLAAITSVSEDAVTRFVREDLAIEKSFLSITES